MILFNGTIDFYTAPASTKYHLSTPGGLLQHSLNVLDALRGLLLWNQSDSRWEYLAAGKVVDTIPDESVTIMALLHDICKTYFYGTSARNVKGRPDPHGLPPTVRPLHDMASGG